MSIGDRIKEERERLGFKQDDFAEKGGVSRRSQVMYEQNKTDASAGYFTKIAELGADVNYILTGVRVATGKLVATTDDAVGSVAETYTLPTGEGKTAANEGLSEEKMEWLRMLDLLDDDAKKATFATTKTLAKNCEMAREFAQFRRELTSSPP